MNINPFCRNLGYENQNVFIMKVVSFPNDSEPIIILFNELASRTSSLIVEEDFSNYLG